MKILILCLTCTTFTVHSTKSPFEIATKSEYFVDQTNFIKELNAAWLEIPYIMISAPRCFSKTVNIDMVRRFFEITIKNNEPQTDVKKTENYELFMSTTPKLRITQDTQFFTDQFGQYPMIYMNLSIDPDVETSDEISTLFSEQVRKSFRYHAWVVNKSNGLSPEEKKIFEDIVSHDVFMPPVDIVNNIKVLAKALSFHFHKKVMLLVDDYDCAIRTALEAGIKTLTIIQQVFHPFGKNFYYLSCYISRALFTGIFEFADLMGLTETFAFASYEGHHDYLFAQYYGLSIDAAKELLRRRNITDEKRINDVIKYYDGYYPSKGTTPVLNPWSIRQYLIERHEKPEPYWARFTGLVDYLTRSLRNPFLQAMCGRLFLNRTLEFSIEKFIGIDDPGLVAKYFNKKDLEFEDVSPYNADIYMTLLYQMGYLTNAGEENFFKIPNAEINDEFIRYYSMYNATFPKKPTSTANPKALSMLPAGTKITR